MDKRFVVFLVAFFSVFAVEYLEGNRKLAQSIWDDGAYVHDDVAEGEWNCCGKELEDSAKPGEGIYTDLSQSSQNGVEFGSPFSVKRTLQNVIEDMVGFRKSIPSQASRDEQDILSNKFEKVFTISPVTPRRSLRETHKWSKLRAVQAVSSQGPASSPSSIASAPREGVPSPSPSASSMSSGKDMERFPSILRKDGSYGPPQVLPQESRHIQKYLIAALITIFMLGLAVIVLLLLLIFSRRRDEPKDGNKYGIKDEKPLLDCSSSYISVGSMTAPTVTNSKSEDVKADANSVCSLDFSGNSPQDEPQKMEAEPQKTEAEPQKTEDKPQKTEDKPQETEAIPELNVKTEALPLPTPEMNVKTEALPLPTPEMNVKTQALPLPTPEMKVKTEALPLPIPEMNVKTQALPLTLPEMNVKTQALPLPLGKSTPPPPLRSPPGTPPPPPPLNALPAPAPPPPPNISHLPPNAPPPMKASSPGHHRRRSSGGEGRPPKTKLKPLFWDKVLANPDHSMVWNEIRSGSFQFNEEMMETLFGFSADKTKNDKTKDSPGFDKTPQLIRIIDAKKAQNLAILLKALNVTTEEVCDALKEGNELPPELSQTLLKMAPTTEEELKLRLYNGELSQLGPAERFLKALVDIPFAFKRLEALLFADTFEEEFSSLKGSLTTLEVACKELKSSRLFSKLLEAVLKTGNRMNDGTYRGGATAFKLDTLLKLSDVKGTDGKTTLLHFVILEIIRSEGIRAARRLKESQSAWSVMTEDSIEDSSQDTEEYHRSLGLQVVSGLSNEMENVKKAAVVDTQGMMDTVSKLGQSLKKIKDFFNTDMMRVDEEDHFIEALTDDLDQAESDIKWLKAEEKRVMDLVKHTVDYFHGKSAKDEGLHLFVIVRDFLLILDKTCHDVKKNYMSMPLKIPKKEALPSSDSPISQESSVDMRRRLFPSLRDRHKDDGFSTDEET